MALPQAVPMLPAGRQEGGAPGGVAGPGIGGKALRFLQLNVFGEKLRKTPYRCFVEKRSPLEGIMPVSLKDFVSEALSEIVLGIAEAKKTISDTGLNAVVAPSIVPESCKESKHVQCYTGTYDADQYREMAMAQLVSFDVAVHASEGGTGKVGVQVAIPGIFKAGGEGGLQAQEKTISRIQFNVPLILEAPPPSKKSRQNVAVF